ncbi:GNAT family N-acetyltransferase [Streptomyces uncialis]|uniref:GNAT family N-acetyltransferase n=1 Tax=Streptomyces uncialis TaxID=1048205 RepID=UPI0038673C77
MTAPRPAGATAPAPLPDAVPVAAPRPALSAEVCRDPDAFAALAPAWQRLFARCSAATPFQHHAWLDSWWRSYGRRGRLRVVLVRSGADLVAAAPLALVRRPVPALVPLGGSLADYTDVLLDDAVPGAADALAAGLADAARGALVDLREVRPGAAAERVYAVWPGPKRLIRDSVCLELPAAPLTELIDRLPRPRAQRARAKLRKLDALGVRQRVVDADEAGAALGNLLELHRLQWQGRKVTAEHLRPRFREHLARAVVPMIRSGHAAVTEFTLDGTVVAVDLTLLAPGITGGYLAGAHPGLRSRKADVATMLLRSDTEKCAAAPDGGVGRGGVLSMLRGDEPYKHHWRPETVVNQRLLLARRPTAPLVAVPLADTWARERLRRARRVLRERAAGGPPGTNGGSGPARDTGTRHTGTGYTAAAQDGAGQGRGQDGVREAGGTPDGGGGP